MAKNFNARSVDVHRFSMIPRADIPRASFRIESGYKTTFDEGYLVPVYLDEVLPGDHFHMSMTAFARMATPIFPLMDNLYLDMHWFFVPNRLVWDNWQKFMGERVDPDDSIDYLIPQCESPAGGYPAGSLQDYMGLPTVGQVGTGNTVSHSALFTRAYNLIYNEWFRDENLQDSVVVDRDDGPDNQADYVLLRRGKRHDYFTSALPWPQKGDSVSLPLGGEAPIYPVSGSYPTFVAGSQSGRVLDMTSSGLTLTGSSSNTGNAVWDDPGLYTDLSQATASTVNELRQAFQLQKMLERDARGGTRYTEIVFSQFGVRSPDARLQRPEYLGGGSTRVNITPIAQTSGTSVSGSDTPLGELAAIGTAVSNGSAFSQAFTEHGMIIGLASVRSDLTYQQGLRRMWSRRTRYDVYTPVFAHLGEQAVLSKEIYCDGSVDDDTVFGYQERWADYRYHPSKITGLFRSTTSGTLDGWHLAQRFSDRPVLSPDFIVENAPMDRVLAVGNEANGRHFIFDALFSCKATRPMPLYSVPGLIDHF